MSAELPRSVRVYVDRQGIRDEPHLLQLVARMMHEQKEWPGYQIDFFLVEVERMRNLKRKYFGQRRVTDVISLNYTTIPGFLEGEIYICVPTARTQAVKYSVTPQEEMLRLAAHGVLHLLGYNDETDAQRLKMHVLEDRALTQHHKKKMTTARYH